MKSVIKLSMLFAVVGLISSSMAALGSAIVELDFQYLSDGMTVVTDGAGVAPGSWGDVDAYDSAGVQDSWRVAGNVPTYATYDTTGLPAGMDGYAINTGGLWNDDAVLGNTGNGFTSMIRVNLLNAGTTDWQVLWGRPTDYIIFIDPEDNINLYIDGVGDTWNVVSAAKAGMGTDTWVDLAFTFDGVGGDGLDDTYCLYLNGQLVYTNTADTGVNNSDVEHLGATGGGGQVFTGVIDYYAYYDGAATAEEIAALAVIPEPATMALLGFGALAMLRKRK